MVMKRGHASKIAWDVRPRQGPTKDRNLQFRGVVSTEFFEFYPVDLSFLLEVFFTLPLNESGKGSLGQKSDEQKVTEAS